MGLIDEYIEINIIGNKKKYYISKGYNVPIVKNKYGKMVTPKDTKIVIKISDMPTFSRELVSVLCEECHADFKVPYCDYIINSNSHNGYYCKSCATKVFHSFKISQARTSITFEKWCLDNNYKDWLDLWDYELNDKSPKDVSYGTKGKHYFKCSRGLHKSELKSLRADKTNIFCNVCNSFGQFLLDTYGDDAIEAYWSKNNSLNPFEITKRTKIKKVWMICGLHGEYLTCPDKFTGGRRCPICNQSKGEQSISEFLAKYNIMNIKQKEFEGLKGLNYGNLSYDFYLPDYNILIEYDGEHHEKPTDYDGLGIEKAKESFIKQVEHDRRKNEYARDKNISLIRINYWEIDFIEAILIKELQLKLESE